MDEDYYTLELSPNSEALRKLLELVAQEPAKGQDMIVLTDDCGAYPKGLTPRMRDWWQEAIQPRRVKAIHELKYIFQDGRSDDEGKGIFVEAASDEIDLDWARGRVDLNHKFQNAHAGQARELKDIRRRYMDQRAALADREPAPMSLWLYLAGLTMCALPEFFINIQGLHAIPGVSPIIAFGLAVIVAIMIASASHIHGEYIKQWDHHFGPQDGNHAFKAMRMIALGFLLLSVSLTLIAYSRYQFILPAINDAIAEGNPPPNIILSAAMTLCGNVLIYGFGLFWSHKYHDEQPGYKESYLKFQKHSKRYDQAYQREVAAELLRLDRNRNQRKKVIEESERQQLRHPSYQIGKERAAAFLAQDARVKALLGEAKADICRRINGNAVKFILHDWDDRAGRHEVVMTPTDFAGDAIKLKVVESDNG